MNDFYSSKNNTRDRDIFLKFNILILIISDEQLDFFQAFEVEILAETRSKYFP